MAPSLYSAIHRMYRKTNLSDRLRKRRFAMIEQAVQLRSGQRVLEIGCGRGIDFAQYAVDQCSLTGIDVADVQRVCDFEFHQLDAKSLPWPDGYFDSVVSIGVLEHIQPLDVLCQVTSEIRRVGKRFCVIVPSVGTWVEPHVGSFFWQLRDTAKKPRYAFELNYFSDEAWLQFPGFVNARVHRYWYAPGVQNLMICSE